jgi:hypothetical protein
MVDGSYIFNDVEDLIKYLRAIQAENPDRVFISSVNRKSNFAVPTKKKNYTSITLVNSFPPETFIGNSVVALSRSVGINLSFILKEFIAPEFLTTKGDRVDGTENNAETSESKIIEVIKSTE